MISYSWTSHGINRLQWWVKKHSSLWTHEFQQPYTIIPPWSRDYLLYLTAIPSFQAKHFLSVLSVASSPGYDSDDQVGTHQVCWAWTARQSWDSLHLSCIKQLLLWGLLSSFAVYSVYSQTQPEDEVSNQFSQLHVPWCALLSEQCDPLLCMAK